MSELDQLEAWQRQASRTLDRMAGEARGIGARGKEVQSQVQEFKAQHELYEKVTALLNMIGEQRQNQAQQQIESLVTRGLQTIFGEELSFHLIAKTAANRAQMDFVVRTTLEDGTQIDTPVMEARGGGLAATIGFLVRLVVLLLSKDRQQTVLFLDETFAMVSAEYLDRLGEFLREIVDKTGVQIIMVTHQPALAEHADKVYRFTLGNGVTQVRAEA